MVIVHKKSNSNDLVLLSRRVVCASDLLCKRR